MRESRLTRPDSRDELRSAERGGDVEAVIYLLVSATATATTTTTTTLAMAMANEYGWLNDAGNS